MICLIFLLSYALYWGLSFSKNKVISPIALEFADFLPLFYLLAIEQKSFLCLFFLIGVSLANVIMRYHNILGGILFFAIYGITSQFILKSFSINFLYLFSCMLVVGAIGLLIVWLTIEKHLMEFEIPMMIAIAAYLVLLTVLAYTSLITKNFGFLCLTVADLSLSIYLFGLCKKNLLLYVSNVIYFLGILLIPMSL